MEKELVELYEAAKKAADAVAADDGGSAEESRCLDALRELKDFPVNYQILVDTQVGKRLRHLTKHPRKAIQTFAADLIEIWKKIIIEETTRNKKNGNGNSDNKLSADGKKRSISIKTEKASQPDIVKREKVEQDFSPRPTKMVKTESDKKMNNGHFVKTESGGSPQPINTTVKQENGYSVKTESGVKINATVKQEHVYSIKMESGGSPQPMKINTTVKQEHGYSVKTESGSSPQPVKVKTNLKQENGQSVKTESGSSVQPVKANTSDSKRPSSVINGPPKLTSMIKCNDEARDNVRKLVCEALSKVSGEADISIQDEVQACDPIRVAVTVESVMFEKWGRSTGANKSKYRSILFNLRDQKNPDFRRKVLLDDVKAESIPTLTPEEMASEERQREIQQIKDKAMFECERAGAPKATTDQFKCGRCGQRETTYHQMQTRSADEPMTTFVTCTNCNNHWKFC